MLDISSGFGFVECELLFKEYFAPNTRTTPYNKSYSPLVNLFCGFLPFWYNGSYTVDIA